MGAALSVVIGTLFHLTTVFDFHFQKQNENWKERKLKEDRFAGSDALQARTQLLRPLCWESLFLGLMLAEPQSL